MDLTIGRFKVEGERAAGGSGTIYAARDEATGERVAVKLLRGLSAAELTRFEREAQALAQIHHPDIVRYVEHGRTPDGLAYLAMEWLDGEDLRSRLARGVLSSPEAIVLGQKVAGALAALHGHRLVHRDVKPGNIFLQGGRVADAKLVDFGLVRSELADLAGELTATGMAVGTPLYMAPEQASASRSIDARADLFSLGSVLYRCVAGRAPFEGEHMVAVLTKVLLEEPTPLRDVRPDAPAPLSDLVSRLLAKDPEQRPATAAIVCRALATMAPLAERAVSVEGEPTGAAPVSSSPSGLTRHELRISTILLIGGLPPAGDATGAEQVREIVHQHGGQLDVLVDGTQVVTLGSHGLVSDQATRAAACALAARAVFPRLPMAITTGRTDVGGPSPIGEVIERAARLLAARRAASAREGGATIAVDGATASLLDAGFEIDAQGEERSLVGWRATELPGRTLVGRVTPMLGREWELQSIEGFFRDCVDEPAARAVLVTGAAGMGKSRLAHEAVIALTRRHPGLEVWWGRGDPLRTSSALSLLGEVIRTAAGIREGEPRGARRRRLDERVRAVVPAGDAGWVAEMLGEIAGTPFPDEASPALRAARQDARIMAERLAAAWEAFVGAAASRGPVVVVLNDLHWADPVSLRIVGTALERLPHKPWLVLGLARPEIHESFPRLWEGGNVQEVRLRPLSRRAGMALAREVLGAAASESTIERIVHRADGNAFYLEELVRAVTEAKRAGIQGASLPETVLGMVQARLAGLDSETRRMLRAASVFGDVFWAGGVSALLGGTISRTDVEILVHREIVVPRVESRFAGERELTFRHALMREGVYATLTDADRARGHGLAAEWLEQHGETDAIVLAQHAELAGDQARAADFLLRAAEQAQRAGDAAAVVDRAERARPHLSTDGSRIRCLYLLAKAHGWNMRWDLAELCADELLRLAAPGGAEWFQALSTRMSAGFMAGRMDGLIAALSAAHTTEILPGAEPAAVEVLSICVQTLCIAGQLGMAAGALARMDAAGQNVAANDFVARSWIDFAHSYVASFRDSDPWTARRHARAAHSHAEAVHDEQVASMLLAVVGMTEGCLGLFDEAERKLRAVEGSQHGLSALVAARYLAFVLIERGSLAEARALSVRWRERIQSEPRPDAMVRDAEWRIDLGQIAAAEGDLEAAAREMTASIDLLRFIPAQWRLAAASLASVRLAMGDVAGALALSTEVMEGFVAEGGHSLRSVLLRLVHAEVLDDAGRRDEARALLRDVCAFIEERAAAIDDPEVRRCYLEQVRENARALALARQWG